MGTESGLWYQDGDNWQAIEGFGEGWKGIYETQDGTLWIATNEWEAEIDTDTISLWRQDGNG